MHERNNDTDFEDECKLIFDIVKACNLTLHNYHKLIYRLEEDFYKRLQKEIDRTTLTYKKFTLHNENHK